MNVGSGREDEGSSSEEDRDEEMVAEIRKTYMEMRRLQRGNVRNPKDPLPEESELHNKRGHLPYRAWCPVCVKARGKEDQPSGKRVR